MKFFAIVALSAVSAINREPLRSWSPTPKADAFKMNYGVPHFGEDPDMIATRVSTSIAEKQYNHYVWPADDPAPPKRDYFVPHFGEDTDISATKSNIANAEKTHSHAFSAGIDGAGSFE